MAQRLNQSQFAILGMLTLCPMSGYDLRQQSQSSIGHFWREGYGQIYPTLKILEAAGLVESFKEQQPGKPDRHVYSITQEGSQCLAAWLKKPVGGEVPRSEILLKLFFGRHADADANLRHVESYRATHQQLAAVYEQTEAVLKKTYKDHPDLPYWLITLSYGRNRSGAMLAWCDETTARLGKLKKRPAEKTRKR